MTRLAITGCGVVSPIGMGRQEFARNWRAGISGASQVGTSFPAPLPSDLYGRIPDFDPAAWLGPKGLRCLDRSSTLAIVAAGLALGDAGVSLTRENETRIGLVLGTSFGSLKSISDFTRESLVHDRPLHVKPMLFPNTVLNSAAGQVAIWHKLKGINATVCGGQLSSLLALQYAGRALRLGYADVVLAGGVEEFCEQLAWSAHGTGSRDLFDCDTASGGYIGEGCALLVVEDLASAAGRGATHSAELVDWSSGFCPQLDPERARDCQLERLVTDMRALLARAGLGARDIAAVATGAPEDDNESVEAAALRVVFEQPLRRVDVKRQVGECYSAAGALQVVAMLEVLAETGPRAPYGMVTAAGRDGALACVLLGRSDPAC